MESEVCLHHTVHTPKGHETLRLFAPIPRMEFSSPRGTQMTPAIHHLSDLIPLHRGIQSAIGQTILT